MMFRKFIGDKKFYLSVLAIALPIMLQNGITSFVSFLDNFMVGLIGTEEMSAVGIVNQLIFVFNLFVLGLCREQEFIRRNFSAGVTKKGLGVLLGLNL